MPKPWKAPELQNKIRQWVEKNPERWYTVKYEDIHVETGVSVSTLYRYFPLIVAEDCEVSCRPKSLRNDRNTWGSVPGDANSLMKKSLRSIAFTMKGKPPWILLSSQAGV